MGYCSLNECEMKRRIPPLPAFFLVRFVASLDKGKSASQSVHRFQKSFSRGGIETRLTQPSYAFWGDG